MTSALVCTSCTLGVQENAVIGLVVLRDSRLIICFAIPFLCVIIEYYPYARKPGVSCTISALVCTSFTFGVQEKAANGLVVIHSAEILLLIICFAIPFLCVIIQYYP